MPRKWLAWLLLVAAIGSLVWGITCGSLWEPYEVSVAELARRIALNLFGGHALTLPDADNSLPIRADLGRGELPFSSAALGFRLFGLSEWAGRLPLALWCVLGLGSLYAALSRLWDRNVALYAVLVLSTTPLYFLQARSLLGDAVTLASFVMAWSGLAAALLAPALSNAARGGFALLGALGLYAGFWCRGAIPSVAVPALAVALPALALRAAPGRLPRALSWCVCALGVLALGLGLEALGKAQQTGAYSVFVGSALATPTELRSADVPLVALLHAAFPWSALAPLALALPWQGAQQTAPETRASALSAALGLAFSIAAAAWLLPELGFAVLPGLGCFAVLVACALREMETGRLGSPLLGLSCAALALMLGVDLRVFPDKPLSGFGIAGVELPESLYVASGRFWLGAALLVALGTVLLSYERESESSELPIFRRAEYEALLERMQRVWDGNLVFALLVLEAGLVGFLLLSAISERLVELPQLQSFGSATRSAVAWGAVSVPALPLLPLLFMLARDTARALFERSTRAARASSFAPTRAQGMLLLCTSLGLAASVGFYPRLAAQISPKLVFERYRELRRAQEPLGLLAERSAAAPYQGGAGLERFEDTQAAFDWLSAHGSTGARRFLVVHKPDLAELNQRFRAQHWGNLPILDARSSEVLLASNRLLKGERDESPFSKLVLDAAPPPQHPLHAVLGDEQLEVLGWSLESPSGKPQNSVVPSTRYRFIVYYRVLAPLTGAWQSFVHIDGLQRRFNADHELLEGKYPLGLWQRDDVLADATDLALEPNFTPGTYQVYFGLFIGTRRLEVTQGLAEDDRIVAGTLQIE